MNTETKTQTIAQRLSAWRQVNHLSLLEAAHVLGIGSITTLGSWLRGKTAPTGNNLAAVERVLGEWERTQSGPELKAITQNFDPHEFALARGWDFNCIEASANGLSEADAEILTEEQQAQLLAWCQKQVAEDQSRKQHDA